MNFIASLAVAAVGFVATVTAPAGPPLLLSAAVLVAGSVCAANVILDRWMP